MGVFEEFSEPGFPFRALEKPENKKAPKRLEHSCLTWHANFKTLSILRKKDFFSFYDLGEFLMRTSDERRSFEKNLLAYFRLKFAIEQPSFEECWLEGYYAAQENVQELDNPFKVGTTEFQAWVDGWWAGFYGEIPLFTLSGAAKSSSKRLGETRYAPVAIEAANQSHWTEERKKLWFKRALQITGIILVAAAAYELASIAA